MIHKLCRPFSLTLDPHPLPRLVTLCHEFQDTPPPRTPCDITELTNSSGINFAKGSVPHPQTLGLTNRPRLDNSLLLETMGLIDSQLRMGTLVVARAVG